MSTDDHQAKPPLDEATQERLDELRAKVSESWPPSMPQATDAVEAAVATHRLWTSERDPDPRTFWQTPAGDLKLTKAYWQDPAPRASGLLSSDFIRLYQYAVGGMIRPFDEARLRPAGYELTLGPIAWYDGEQVLLSEKKPDLAIPPNSIVFVSMREQLLLPHYLAARFDLSLRFIYQGLLLGAGPQVDPGYQGVLSCPIHNISDKTVYARLNEPIARIDFVKTTGIPREAGLADTEKEFYENEGALVGADGRPPVLWKRKGRWREPIRFEPAALSVVSSVRAIEQDAADAKRRVGTIQAALFISVLGLLVAGITFGTNYINRQVDDLKTGQLQELREAVPNLRDKVDAAATARDVEALRDDVDRLQRRLDALP